MNALEFFSKDDCSHEEVRVTGDLIVFPNGVEIGIAICKICGKEVPEPDGENEY